MGSISRGFIRLGLGAALLTFGIGAATAADLLIPVAPAPEPSIDWTGFYAGVHLGYASAGVSGAWSGSVPPFSAQGDLVPYDMTGGLIGGQVGYNFQMDSIVLGIEGSLSLSNLSGGEVQFEPPPVLVEANSTINWSGDLVARGGIAIDNLLFYGSVGLAFANVDLDVDATGFSTASDSNTHFGPTVGIGAEYRIDDQWSIGADLRYAALGEQEYSDPAVIDGTANLNLDKTSFTIRLNYRF